MNNSNTSSAQQLHPAEIEILSYTNENPSSQNTGKLLSDIAHNVEAADFQSLAFRYLGEELTTASGDPRLPTQKRQRSSLLNTLKTLLKKRVMELLFSTAIYTSTVETTGWKYQSTKLNEP